MKDFEAGKSLRSVIVDAIDEAGDVTVLIRTNDKASWRVCSIKECHHAVPVVAFPILQVINVSHILRDYG